MERQSMYQQVSDFQEQVLKNPVKPRPCTELSDEFKQNVPVFLAEELEELDAAINSDNLPETADALVDLVYFALGALHSMGVDGDAAFQLVHQANMTKQRGIKPTRGLAGDAFKPESWVAPDMASLFSN